MRAEIRDAVPIPGIRSRAHVWVVGESILEDFGNRTSRPHEEWQPIVDAALREAGYEFDRLLWDQNAGCSVCPCSPGFWLLNEPRMGGENEAALQVWVNLHADDEAPQTTDIDKSIHRADQLVEQTGMVVPEIDATVNVHDGVAVTDEEGGKR